jgi:hypothetical protein
MVGEGGSRNLGTFLDAVFRTFSVSVKKGRGHLVRGIAGHSFDLRLPVWSDKIELGQIRKKYF